MFRILKNFQFLCSAGVIGLDVFFFSITNPQKGSSFTLIIGFILFAVTLIVVSRSLLQLGNTYGRYKIKNYRKLPYCISGVVIGLFALQSIGELSLKDALIFIPLSILLYVYLTFGRLKIET